MAQTLYSGLSAYLDCQWILLDVMTISYGRVFSVYRHIRNEMKHSLYSPLQAKMTRRQIYHNE